MLVDLIILNYKNYNDTIELLNSVFSGPRISSISNIHIIDNDSKNESLAHILESLPILASEKTNVSDVNLDSITEHKTHTYNIITYQAKKNLGYAGGNNFGLKGFLSGNSDLAIVCNNDVVFPVGQLEVFIDESIKAISENENVGLVGNVLYFYDHPELIQASGGKINKSLCRTRHLNVGMTSIADRVVPDYPIGALLLFSREVLQEVGLLSEEYFLYYEELDYVNRMRNKSFTFEIMQSAKILHKEGASAGSNSRDYKSVSLISDYFMNVNKIRYSRRFNRKYLFLVTAVVIVNAFRRLFRGELKKCFNIMLFLFGKKVY
ncbi:TPA: hypothetical protein ACGUXQ_002761 [Vibrio vulnificus]